MKHPLTILAGLCWLAGCSSVVAPTNDGSGALDDTARTETHEWESAAETEMPPTPMDVLVARHEPLQSRRPFAPLDDALDAWVAAGSGTIYLRDNDGCVPIEVDTSSGYLGAEVPACRHIEDPQLEASMSMSLGTVLSRGSIGYSYEDDESGTIGMGTMGSSHDYRGSLVEADLRHLTYGQGECTEYFEYCPVILSVIQTCTDGTTRDCSRCGESALFTRSCAPRMTGQGIGVATQIVHAPAAVDCSLPCPADTIQQEIRAANATLDGVRWIPAGADEPVVAVFFRSEADCLETQAPGARVLDDRAYCDTAHAEALEALRGDDDSLRGEGAR